MLEGQEAALFNNPPLNIEEKHQGIFLFLTFYVNIRNHFECIVYTSDKKHLELIAIKSEQLSHKRPSFILRKYV